MQQIELERSDAECECVLEGNRDPLKNRRRVKDSA
jgi:hypothetical protein